MKSILRDVNTGKIIDLPRTKNSEYIRKLARASAKRLIKALAPNKNKVKILCLLSGFAFLNGCVAEVRRIDYYERYPIYVDPVPIVIYQYPYYRSYYPYWHHVR